MGSTTGPNLGMLHSWASRESGWNTGIDSDLKKLDTVVQLSVKDRALNTPPGSPANGDRYILGAAPTGAWSGHANEVAVYAVSAWTFYAAKAGWLAYVEDEARLYIWSGSAWVLYDKGTGGATRKLWIPAGVFTGTTARIARRTNTATGYSALPFSGSADDSYFTEILVPTDFGSVVDYKLYVLNSVGGSAANVDFRFGLDCNLADGAIVNESTDYATTVFALPSTIEILKIQAVTNGGLAIITAGAIAKVYLHRLGASDANANASDVLGVLFSYTAA